MGLLWSCSSLVDIPTPGPGELLKAKPPVLPQLDTSNRSELSVWVNSMSNEAGMCVVARR
jgi:hypothetical protein